MDLPPPHYHAHTAKTVGFQNLSTEQEERPQPSMHNAGIYERVQLLTITRNKQNTSDCNKNDFVFY